MASSTQTVTVIDYATITITLWAVPQGIRYVIDVVYLNAIVYPNTIDNIMFFVDGEYVVSRYDLLYGNILNVNNSFHTMDPPSQAMTVINPTHVQFRGHLRLSYLQDQSRGVRTLNINFFDAENVNKTIAYTTLSIDLTPFSNQKYILRALFNLSPTELQNTSGLLAAVKAAGINSLISGIYTNPGDSNLPTQSDWEAASNETKLRPALDYCTDNEFYLFGAGDDFVRSAAEQNWLLTGSYSTQSIQRAAYVAQTYGGVLSKVDWVDESPSPPSDPVGSVQKKLIDNWRVYGGSPGAWPMQGTQSAYPTGWENITWSEYGSRYVALQDWRPARSDGLSILQVHSEYSRIRRDYNSSNSSIGFPLTWDLVVEIECNGETYTKMIAGNDYTPGYDTLQNNAVRPINIIAACWMAIIYGANGLKAYSYDSLLWQSGRTTAAIGTPNLQTGAKPGGLRWTAISTAFNSIRIYEQAILSNPIKYNRVGSWLIGYNGAIKIVINLSERTEAYPLARGGIMINTATNENGIVYDGTDAPAGSVIINA